MNKKIKTADELGALGRRLEMAGKFLQLAEKVSEIQKNLRRAQIEEAREIIIDVSERLNVNYPPEKPKVTKKIDEVPTYPDENLCPVCKIPLENGMTCSKCRCIFCPECGGIKSGPRIEGFYGCQCTI